MRELPWHARGQTAMVVPKIWGQEGDYLVMSLRAYRDDRRESTMMHKMSMPYGDSIIESIACFYASQPPKKAPGRCHARFRRPPGQMAGRVAKCINRAWRSN